MKKLLAIVLSLLMVMSLAVPAMADTSYSITINNPHDSNVSMEGKTYNAYKIFDATYAGDDEHKSVSYTIARTSPWVSVIEGYITSIAAPDTAMFALKDITGDTANYLVVPKDGATAEDARKFADYLTEKIPNDVTPNTATADNADTVTISVDAAGYYIVTGSATPDAGDDDDEVVAATALTNVVPNATIDLKVGAPTIVKKIVEDDNEVDANDAKVGDTVNYKVTSSVPDMTGYPSYFFKVTDTMSKGLTYDNNAVIAIDGTDVTSKFTITSTTSEDGITTIKFEYSNPAEFITYTKGTDNIVITYSATINENAVIGNLGNPNKVNLEYSNKPSDATSHGTTPDDTVVTYVTGIKITKKDGDTKHVLAGATFSITGTGISKIVKISETFTEAADGTYYKLKDGTFTTVAPTPETAANYESESIKYKKAESRELINKPVDVDITVTSGEDGIISFAGLNEGNYTITEISTPDGYNLLESPITVNITSNVDSITDPTDASTITWSVDATGATAAVDTDGIIKFDVENNKGSKLPETGGIGTTIFYVVGGLMMAVAVVLLVTKKKVNGK